MQFDNIFFSLGPSNFTLNHLRARILGHLERNFSIKGIDLKYIHFFVYFLVYFSIKGIDLIHIHLFVSLFPYFHVFGLVGWLQLYLLQYHGGLQTRKLGQAPITVVPNS